MELLVIIASFVRRYDVVLEYPAEHVSVTTGVLRLTQSLTPVHLSFFYP